MFRMRNASSAPFGIAVAMLAGLLVADPAAAQTARKLNCTGCVKSKEIQNGGIGGADIRRNAIAGSKIKNNTISGNKIKDGSIGSEDLGDGEVQNSDLANNAVTRTKIRNNAVTGNKIADDSITADDLADGSVGNSELVDNTVDSDKITDRSINSWDIAFDTVGYYELRDSARGYGSFSNVIVPFSAFQPDTESENYKLVPFSGYLRPDALDTTICMTAPVYLPHGVTIDAFHVILFDNNAITNFTFILRRVNINTDANDIGTVDALAGVTTSGGSPVIVTESDLSISHAEVHATNYAYYISGCITTDDTSLTSARLYSARVSY